MSVGLSENESKENDTTVVDESTENQDQNQQPDGSTDSSSEAQTEGDFNPAEFEATFGLPAGMLKDAKTAEDATAVVRQYVGRSFMSGIAFDDNFAGGASVPETKDDVQSKGGDKGGKPADKSYEDLLARVERMERDQLRKDAARVNARVMKRIDSYNSPKYGTSKNRNYPQLNAVNELRAIAARHCDDLLRSGEEVTDDMIETLVDRARVFHDPDYLPQKAAKKEAGTGGAPLGTPGSRKASETNSKAPANIHEALGRNTAGFF